jgi:hypothetical protein
MVDLPATPETPGYLDGRARVGHDTSPEAPFLVDLD